MVGTCLLVACEAQTDTGGEEPADLTFDAAEQPGDEEGSETGVAPTACDYGAQGRAMDRFTAMCRSWGYDQGVFSYSGCSITLDYCIEW